MKIFIKKVNKINLAICAVLFFFPLFVYVKTLLPGPEFGDPGELQAACYTLGITHPPGYPTYIILGKLFTFLPFGSVAWRVNFMSAFFSALSLILTYFIVKKITKSKMAGFLSSLILAFSNNFWSFSLVAEMYSLNVFFIALFILFNFISPKSDFSNTPISIIRGFIKKRGGNWRKKKRSNSGKNISEQRFYIWLFFLLGIAQGNHRGITPLVPVFVFFLFLRNPKFFLNLKKLLFITYSFVVGLSIYLFIPIRSLQKPYLNYNHPDNWKNFWYLVSAKQFRFLMFTYPIEKLLPERIPWFYKFLQEQFFSFGLMLSLLGIVFLIYKKKFKVLTFFLLLFLANTIVWLFYNTDDIHRYLTPSVLIIIFFIGCGLGLIFELVNLIKNHILKRVVFLGLLLGILTYPLFLLKVNYKKVDQSENFGPYNWGVSFMEKLKPSAVVMSFWPYSAVMWSFQACDGIRPDVFIADERVILDEGWKTDVNTAKHFVGKRPVYIIPYADKVKKIKEHFNVIEKNGLFEVVPY